MTVIARDAVASDHLVYAWPFPIGPECEVTCAEDEQVVMCPAWLVGDRLGPGRHVWRTPDPTWTFLDSADIVERRPWSRGRDRWGAPR